MIGGYNILQGVTRDYKRLQEVTRGYNESRGDTGG